MSLEAYYDMMFSMTQHHKWSMTEVEMMLPWERDIYVDKLIQHVREENEKLKEQQRNLGM
jgi:hypothetical protein|tara:strand:- start:223 stop:402 length:180 start_codon:yes stop_codon:yes gene_type:complete